MTVSRGSAAGSRPVREREEVTSVAKTADGDEKDPDRPRYFLQSLERGFEVIRAFDADHPAMTLADVARQTGMTRATARRCLLTLADLEYVRSDGRMFTLSPRVLDLGYAYLSGTGLPGHQPAAP